MKTSWKTERQPGRCGILANFQFYVGENAKETCEGITLNISDRGFGFLTETEISQGQIITVTKHALPDFPCGKATVIWARKGPRCIEAGAEFHSAH